MSTPLRTQFMIAVNVIVIAALWALSCILCYDHGRTSGMLEMHEYYST